MVEKIIIPIHEPYSKRMLRNESVILKSYVKIKKYKFELQVKSDLYKKNLKAQNESKYRMLAKSLKNL